MSEKSAEQRQPTLRQLAALGARALTGTYKVHGDLETVNAVVAFSFDGQLYPPPDPAKQSQRLVRGLPGGRTNGDLTWQMGIYEEMLRGSVPVVAQWEIFDGLTHWGHRADHSITEHRETGRRLDTREVAVQAVNYLQTAGLLREGGSVAVVAAAPHMPRADATMQQLLSEHGMTTVAPDGLQPVLWNPNSSLIHSSDPLAWAAWEIASILHYARQQWLDVSLAV